MVYPSEPGDSRPGSTARHTLDVSELTLGVKCAEGQAFKDLLL
jgi:hypothetical protein